MSEILLSAILHIFAIFTAKLPAARRDHARERVRHYLSDHLGISEYSDFLGLYDDFLSFYDDDEDVDIERAALIADGLTDKLDRLDQYVLVLRFFEICSGVSSSSLSAEISSALMQAFGFPDQVRDDLILFNDFDPSSKEQSNFIGFVNFDEVRPSFYTLHKEDFSRRFSILFIQEVDAYFIKAENEPLHIDGVTIPASGISLLRMGAIIRDQHRNPVYYSEIVTLLSGKSVETSLCFSGRKVNYRFPGSDNGLHNFSFKENGGRLVGIMGGSGAGKSTLINILNGSIRPDSGSITINNIDLYAEKSRLDGVIGVVPQDDLLFEELTVFENLFYNARLCMSHLSHEQLAVEVDKTLKDLNQFEIRDLKVGSPLEKTISGGQRKRLNIALELIRQPTILFVDEPTSGLSSSDSENVMNLLKAQAAQGKLVMVVIHQPSSRIFKMFDKLWILDRGGRPIFNGNPIDAITYFKRAVHLAGMEESSCQGCGNVNPEQIFELIEMRTLDKYGHSTDERRVEPEKWHQLYLDYQKEKSSPAPVAHDSLAPPAKGLHRPSLAGQFKIFFQRNFKARVANRQYVLVNLLEPPLLALFIAGLCRGFGGNDYVFMDNENIGVYFFMGVIVAVFLGLSISAEEINRDRKILARERFLNLSWASYLNSKVVYLALVTGIQMLLYTLCANFIVELPGMFWAMLLILFSCGMTSCLLGLNISASFKTAVTIYILIPLLIIPQMLLCGVVIGYDQLIPENSGNRLTPWYADLVPSRWGYEALVVDQYRNNGYMNNFFDDEGVIRQSEYMVDYHLPEIRSLADYIFLRTDLPDKETVSSRNLRIIGNELQMLEQSTGISSGLPEELALDSFGRVQFKRLKDFIQELNTFYNTRRREAAKQKDQVAETLISRLGQDGFDALQERNHNTSIKQLALNELELESVAVSGHRLIQKVLPVFRQPWSKSGRAHFYAEQKRLGALSIPTFYFNLMMLWMLGLVGYLAICNRVFPRLIKVFHR